MMRSGCIELMISDSVGYTFRNVLENSQGEGPVVRRSQQPIIIPSVELPISSPQDRLDSDRLRVETGESRLVLDSG